MKKSFVEEKVTNVEFTAEDVQGTPFVKWFASIIVDSKINGATSIPIECSEKCGFCLKEDFENLNSIEMPPTTVYVEEMYKKSAYVVAIKKSAMLEVLSCKKHITDVIEKVNIQNINSSEYAFYLFNVGSYQLMNLNFVFVPIPIFMDSIETGLTNENYNLDKILAIIKGCMYVVDRENVQIRDIPYYNATETETKKIDFYINLLLEDYEKYQSFESTYEARQFILKEVLNIK